MTLQLSDQPGFLSFRQRVIRLKKVLLLIYLLGFANGIPASVVPALQHSTFGNHVYLIKGLFTTGKAILSCVYTPLLGAASDNYGRRPAIAFTLAISALPFIAFLVTPADWRFWAYCVADSLFGLYAPTLSLTMAAVTDFIPRNCPVRTESFAVTMAFFLLGIATGPLVGFGVTGDVPIFITSAIIQAAGGLIAFLILPRVTALPAEEAEKAIAAAAAAGVCPVIAAAKKNEEEEPTTCLKEGEDTENNNEKTPNENDEDEAAVPTPAPAAAVRRCPFHPPIQDDKRQPLLAASEVATTVAPAVLYGSIAPTTAEEDPLNAQHDINDSSAESQKIVVPSNDGEEAAKESAPQRIWTLLRTNGQIRILGVAVFWSYMCQQVLENFIQLYLNEELHFSKNDQIMLLFIVASSGLLCLALVVTLMKQRIGTLRTMQASIIANALYNLLYCFVTKRWEALAVPTLGLVGYGVFPCMCSLVALQAGSKYVGAAQGIATGMRMLAEAVGPLLFGAMFDAAKGFVMPGIPFLGGAVCGVVALILTLWVKDRQ